MRGLYLVAVSRGYSQLPVCGFSFSGSSLLSAGSSAAGFSSWCSGLEAVAQALSCLEACGIFPDQVFEPMLPAFGWILAHWTTGETIKLFFFNF